MKLMKNFVNLVNFLWQHALQKHIMTTIQFIAWELNEAKSQMPVDIMWDHTNAEMPKIHHPTPALTITLLILPKLRFFFFFFFFLPENWMKQSPKCL